MVSDRSEIHVKRFRVADQPRPIVELVDQYNCLYCPLASLYLTLNEEKSHNTVIRTAYELKFFLLWLVEKKINIHDRVKSGDFLSDQETNDFCSITKYHNNHKQDIPVQSKVTNKYLTNVLQQNTYRDSKISPSVTNGRLICASKYIKFLDQELNRNTLTEINEKKLERTLFLLDSSHRKEVRSGLTLKDHIDKKTITPEVMDRIFEITNINHHDNPFNKNVRLRNQIIIRLLIDTGIRRGALAKLKISDVTFGGKTQKIYISRLREDSSDTRANKPEQKTKDHFSYPTQETMNMLKEYIENHRASIKMARTHEFVFVSEGNARSTKGKPISLDSINYIFEIISKNINQKTHPHILRHCWNERFTDLANDNNLTDNEIDKYRKLLMGWSPTSIMPEKYNKIRDIERANELHREHQRALL